MKRKQVIYGFVPVSGAAVWEPLTSSLASAHKHKRVDIYHCRLSYAGLWTNIFRKLKDSFVSLHYLIIISWLAIGVYVSQEKKW